MLTSINVKLTFDSARLGLFNCLPFFVFTTKTTQPHPQVFSVNGALTCKNAAFFYVISSLDTKFLQIW